MSKAAVDGVVLAITVMLEGIGVKVTDGCVRKKISNVSMPSTRV